MVSKTVHIPEAMVCKQTGTQSVQSTIISHIAAELSAELVHQLLKPNH